MVLMKFISQDPPPEGYVIAKVSKDHLAQIIERLTPIVQLSHDCGGRPNTVVALAPDFRIVFICEEVSVG